MLRGAIAVGTATTIFVAPMVAMMAACKRQAQAKANAHAHAATNDHSN